MKLTREQILEASDEELNELVTKYVMEWDRDGPFSNYYTWDTHFSTDISAAWQVVEKMTVKNLGWKFYNTTDNSIGCLFEVKPNSGEGVWATADTAPRAICKAALLAMV